MQAKMPETGQITVAEEPDSFSSPVLQPVDQNGRSGGDRGIERERKECRCSVKRSEIKGCRKDCLQSRDDLKIKKYRRQEQTAHHDDWDRGGEKCHLPCKDTDQIAESADCRQVEKKWCQL